MMVACGLNSPRSAAVRSRCAWISSTTWAAICAARPLISDAWSAGRSPQICMSPCRLPAAFSTSWKNSCSSTRRRCSSVVSRKAMIVYGAPPISMGVVQTRRSSASRPSGVVRVIRQSLVAVQRVAVVWWMARAAPHIAQVGVVPQPAGSSSACSQENTSPSRRPSSRPGRASSVITLSWPPRPAGARSAASPARGSRRASACTTPRNSATGCQP